jgi:hypothetical protein
MRFAYSSPVVMAFLLVTSTAHAQTDPDSVKLRNDCRLASQVLRTGHPAPHLDWARGMIRYCGHNQWADAVAAAISRTRSSTNERELASEWRHLWMLKDAVLLDSVQSIASDHSASVGSRLWALRTLANLIDPEGIYGALTETDSGDPDGRPVCIVSRAAGVTMSYTRRPLPPDYVGRARATAASIISDESDVPTLRTAARCVQAAPVYGVGRRGT